MKHILLSISLVFMFSVSCMAKKEYADGYIITKNNDTNYCKIIIPKDFGKFNEMELFSKVYILDSNGKSAKLTPDDINGYAFSYQSRTYVYTSKKVDDEGKTVFVWPINLGKKINEYYYYYYNSADMDKGGMGAVTGVYVLE